MEKDGILKNLLASIFTSHQTSHVSLRWHKGVSSLPLSVKSKLENTWWSWITTSVQDLMTWIQGPEWWCCQALLHHIWRVIVIRWSLQCLKKKKETTLRFLEREENKTENSRLGSLTSVSGKIMQQILLENVLGHIKDRKWSEAASTGISISREGLEGLGWSGKLHTLYLKPN